MTYQKRYRKIADDGFSWIGWDDWQPVDEIDVRATLGSGRDKWTWQILSERLRRGRVVEAHSLVQYRMAREPKRA